MNDKTKIVKNVLIGFTIAGEVIWMLLWVFGSVMQFLTHDADVSLFFMPVLMLHALWLMIISIGQMVRNNREKRFVILTGLGMKAYTLLWLFSFISLVSDNGENKNVIIGSFVFDVIIGAMIFSLYAAAKRMKNDPPYVPTPVNRFYPGAGSIPGQGIQPRFQPLTVSSVWGDAASEYCRINGKKLELLDEDERHMITICAATPAAYILTWLARRRLLNEGRFSPEAADVLVRIKSLDADPALFLLEYMDGRIATPDISDSALLFAHIYFQYDPFSPSGVSTRNFIFDYYDAVCSGEGRYYCIPFSAKKYTELEKRMDAALEKFSQGADIIWDKEYEERGEAFCAMLGQQVSIKAERYVSQSDIDSCISGLAQKDPDTTLLLCEKLMRYCSTGIAAYVNEPLSILEKLSAYEVIILPRNGETGYIIMCESELEPEHGIAVTIREKELIDVTYASDASSPWTLAADMIYMLRKEAREASLRYIVDERSLEHAKALYLQEVYTIPVSFSENTDRDDSIFLPHYAAQLKFRCDKMIRALAMTGYALGGVTYECYPGYDPSHPVPRRLRIISKRKADGYTLFDDTIQVW